MYIIIIFILLFLFYYFISRKIEKYKDIDRTDPDVIKKVLNTNDYSSEKKKVSYAFMKKPRQSIRYFLNEHRSDYIEDIPFSPHIILKSENDIDISSKIHVKNKIDRINEIDEYISELNQNDFCIKNKHLAECITAERNYKCFGKIEFTEKECTANTDLIGNRVEPGLWDRKCVANEECPFYKANKNFPNDFGKCVNGYCDLPKGINRISTWGHSCTAGCWWQIRTWTPSYLVSFPTGRRRIG